MRTILQVTPKQQALDKALGKEKPILQVTKKSKPILQVTPKVNPPPSKRGYSLYA